MIRVLHLLDAEADFQTRRGVEALTRSAGDDFSLAIRLVNGVLGDAVRRGRAGGGRETFDIVHAGAGGRWRRRC